MLLGTREGSTEEIAFELNLEGEDGICQDKSQEQENLRKKEINVQDVA